LFDGDSFPELIRRVRSGDEDAAARLVRAYEPEIRRIVRLRLTDPYLRRLVDSVDVCQSVLANFFVRVALGQFQLDSPESLLKLLATMTRNKLLNLARDRRRERRARQVLEPAGSDLLPAIADPGATPSHLASCRDLLHTAQRRLSERERFLAERRAAGFSWADLAAELGGSPDALRKQLARAVKRVARQLGLQEDSRD
jgi:RNA polymerase sigma-70 factor (ECF subfamily)